MKINKRELFKMAWGLLDNFTSFSQSLRQAWKILKLKAKMAVGNVKFKYRKVDGTIRDAVGTLNFTYESKGSGRPTPADSFLYYDCEAKGIRSFKVVNLIRYEIH